MAWASEFAGAGHSLSIESDWTLGSPVQWKDSQGKVIVDGRVTAADPPTLLRFTVFDVRTQRPEAGPEDGITFKLTERSGKTVLWVSQGDFSTMADGAKFRDLSAEIWDRALAKVKWQVEHPIGYD